MTTLRKTPSTSAPAIPDVIAGRLTATLDLHQILHGYTALAAVGCGIALLTSRTPKAWNPQAGQDDPG